MDDMLNFLNRHDLPNPFIKIIEPLQILIDDLISQNAEFTYRKFENLIRSCFNPNAKSRLSIEFWLNRGYTESEALSKIKALQSANSLEYAKKRRENPQKYFTSNPNRKEYWIKKEYSEEEATSIIQKRQSRDLHFYQQKYGEKEGLEKYTRRNEKWLTSINQSRGVTWNSNSTSLSHLNYQKRYGDEWLLYKISHIKNEKRKKKLSLIYEIVYLQKKSLFDFFLDSTFDVACDLSTDTVFVHLTGKNYFESMSIWMSHNKIDKIKRGDSWGYAYYVNGKYYQSTGEYKIGCFLERENISFELHKRYEGTNRISDFFITDLNLYVELTGMSSSSYTLKKKQLKKMPYKIIWSSNCEYLIDYINEEIHRIQEH